MWLPVIGKSSRLLRRHFLTILFITCLQFVDSVLLRQTPDQNECSDLRPHGIKVLVWKRPLKCHYAQRPVLKKLWKSSMRTSSEFDDQGKCRLPPYRYWF